MFIKPEPALINLALRYLSSFHSLSEDFKEEFTSKLFEIKAKKGEYLLKQGETSQFLYFIVTGIVIGYTTMKHKKLTTYICADGDTVSSISGMYGEGPSGESIYVVEDSHLIGLPISDLVNWLESSFEMNVIIRKILESFYKTAHERSNLVRMGTAKEKYEHFLSSTSLQIERVPSAYIADYLDIKPLTLERIIKEQKATLQPFVQEQCALIEDYMTRQQSFKQQRLTLSMMANALAIPAHQLSHILNFYYKKSFSNFVNGYRIEYIKAKLQGNSDWQRLKIEALGIESGFSSRSVFFAEFKIHAGITPAEYARINNKI